MRFMLAPLLLTLSLANPVFSTPAEVPQLANFEEDELGTKRLPDPAIALPKDSADGDSEVVQPTTFNGISVPPMKALDGDTFDEDVKSGYWFVKHWSPYCGHCKAIAPTWQTLYELYYTSKPVPSNHKFADTTASLNSFQAYYNFHFAALDCIAWGDACVDNGVENFPTFVLYKDREEVKRFVGKKTMEGLSEFIEDILESIKPGSRPVEGLTLPEPGDDSIKSEAKSETAKTNDNDGSAGGSTGQQLVSGSKLGSGKTTFTSSKLTTKPKQPVAKPNPAGTSISLTQESFQKLVTTSQDPWFIKFYAPWCHHCQALAPNWHQMSKELEGKLNIGEVNCDVESRLCKDVRVRGYPTIHFFRGGERVEYDGLRGLGDLVSYAKKAMDVGMGVPYVDAIGYKEMEETEEVIFVYFYDHATTTEDFKALERLTLSLIGHAKLVKTDSAVLADRYKIHTWPRLIVSRDGRPSYYNALAPKDMRDFRQVLDWMQSVWLPIVPELTASNSREIMRGRIVVLGILSRERSDEFILDKREIKNAAIEWMDRETHAFQLERQEMRDAKHLRIEEAEDRNDQRALRAAKVMRIEINEADRKQVGFAWVDGVFWERWIKTTYGIEVKDGERVVINDEDNKRYWDTTAFGGQIVPSRTSILETLPKVIADPPRLSPKYTTGKIQQVFYQGRRGFRSHPWLSTGMLLLAVIAAAMWGRRRIRRTKGMNGNGGFFQLDGKEGLLNGGTAGKVD